MRAQPGATRNRRRRGRGASQGQGDTSGRGHKGQRARKSGNVRPGFEGGQSPLYRRLPKRGFTNIHRRERAVFNVRDLEIFGLKEVSLESLLQSDRVRNTVERLTILGDGELKKAVTVKAHKVTAQAKEKIEKAGGKVEIIQVLNIKGKKKKLARNTAAAAAR